MKVLITGKGGQLAWELEQTVPESVVLTSLGIEDLDITDMSAVNACFQSLRPDVVINAAAYTAVDKAETDQDTAYAVNESGASNLAIACANNDCFMVQVSTDFVFDGKKASPYNVSDEPRPLNHYGASKLAGDNKVSALLGNKALIVRTAWVYSAHGNNFVKTMLRLMKEKEELNVVCDQIGTPTWARGLANWIWATCFNAYSECIENTNDQEVTPIYHWTDAGVASWYDFAVAIHELGREMGLLERNVSIRPIPATCYPTPAVRPSFSVLNKQEAEKISGIETQHWRSQLSKMLKTLRS